MGLYQVDVALPLVSSRGSKIELWLDLKTEADANKLWCLVGNFFSHSLPDGPRIFLSLYAFQQHQPRQYKSKSKNEGESKPKKDKKEKSAHDHYYTVMGIIKVYYYYYNYTIH